MLAYQICRGMIHTLHHKGAQLGGQLKGNGQTSLEHILFDLQEKLISVVEKKNKFNKLKNKLIDKVINREILTNNNYKLYKKKIIF